MRYFILFKIITILSGITFLPQAYAAQPVDRIVAIVEEDIILRSELDERVRTISSQIREQGNPLPPLSVLEKQVLDRLVLSKLQIQMAENTGIRVDDETLNRTVSGIAAENQLNLTQFRQILEEDGYSYDSFREDIRNEILLARLRQRQVDNRIVVTDREVDDFLMNMQHQGGLQQEFQISHILLSLPESPSSEDVEKTRSIGERILTDLEAGGDIAGIATKYSSDEQIIETSDLGWRKYSQVPTLFVDFITEMDEGDYSELIRSPSGYHIIQLRGVREGEEIVVTQTHARHILIKPSEIMSESDVINRLRSLKNRIESGDDFGDLARGNSEDLVSAAAGGDLGWTSPGDMVPEFENEMSELAINEISEPFQTQYGYHIVQVLDRRQHDSTHDTRRARAREAIYQRKLEEERETWAQQMLNEAYVEYRLDQ
ncbi:MAG: peptidylprolyl isomerase [Gammaproteobacteria bacterium]